MLYARRMSKLKANWRNSKTTFVLWSNWKMRLERSGTTMNFASAWKTSKTRWVRRQKTLKSRSQPMGKSPSLIAPSASSRKSKRRTTVDSQKSSISSGRSAKSCTWRCSSTWIWWRGDRLSCITRAQPRYTSRTVSSCCRSSSSTSRSWRCKARPPTWRTWSSSDRKSSTTSNNSWLISMTLRRRSTLRCTSSAPISSKSTRTLVRRSKMQKTRRLISRRRRKIRKALASACTGLSEYFRLPSSLLLLSSSSRWHEAVA